MHHAITVPNLKHSGAPRVLIVGGRGQMGKVFHRLFLDVDFDVQILDLDSEVSPEGIVPQMDVVVIAVPILKTLSIIEQIAPLVGKDSVLMDITSLKAPFVKRMQELCQGEVIGTHPLFGPLEIIKGQTVAMIGDKDGRWYQIIHKIFNTVGLKIVETNEVAHDRTMGVVQSLIHFISIALSATVYQQRTELGSNIDKLTTHYYLLHKNLAGRLLDQDPELYADIAFMNEDIVPILESFVAEFQRMIEFLKHNDRSKFIEHFKTCSQREENKHEAYHIIERIMEYLAEIQPS